MKGYYYTSGQILYCIAVGIVQGVTKRCRLSWLTNSALVYESKCGGRGGGGCGVSANEYSCAHEAQINFGYLTPYLTYGLVGVSSSPLDSRSKLGLESALTP